MEAKSADIDKLLSWFEQQLDPIWVANSKESEHPFKHALRSYREPRQNRDILLSQDLLRTLAFAKTIRALSKFPTRRRSGLIIKDQFFRDQLINRAKQSVAEFYATEMEATVGWAYAGVLGQPIIALEAGEKPTPDFEITAQGLPIFIECKARNIVTPLHRRIVSARSEIISRIRPLLNRSAVNYGICISTNQAPDRAAIPDLAKTISALLPSGRAFSRSLGNFNVEATILLPKDKEVITPTLEPLGSAEHVPEPVRGFMIRNGVSNPTTYAGVHYEYQMRKGNDLIYYRNPKVLVVHVAVITNHIKAVTELIRDGRKQLPRTAPGIIAIRAPDFYRASQFLQLGQGISHTLGSTSRVSGVVLWHQAIRPEIRSLTEWEQTLWWQIFCIRNKGAQYPLPRSFESSYLPHGDGFEVLNQSSVEA
jgi:hypothetical protein